MSCFSCKKEWKFHDTAMKAQMSKDEELFWSIKISLNAVGDECPKCGYYCQRIAVNSDRVICVNCTNAGISYEYCWKCKSQWSDRHNCKEKIQQMLLNCKRKTMPYSNVENVPSLRVCPSCGNLIEHQDMCKEIKCSKCEESFCFICLTMCQNGLKCSSYNLKCTVAPIQNI